MSYRIIFRLLYSARHFCGSVGSDLMQEVRLRQTVLHFTHLQQLTLLPACAMLSWMIIDIIKGGKPTVVGACTGGVIGLVAITPGAGFVPIWASFIIGALVSPICYFALSVLKPKFGYDDALDAFGCHGIGGIWGGIATGLFAQTSINPVAKWDGLVFGDYHLFVAQVLSILVTIAVAVVGTLICVGIVRLFTKLRVDENSENVGLDDSEHGERAYSAIWE